MYNFTMIILGKEINFEKQLPVDILYYEGNLEKTLKKVKTKYVLFIKSTDYLSNKYFDKVISKTKKDFDCCYINFKCNYINKENNKIPTEYKELKDTLPLYGSYIWSFIFKTEVLLKILKINDKDNFNEKINEIVKVKDCINEIVYFHKPNIPSVIKEKDLCYVDHKSQKHIKNAIYIGNGISGTFNGYVSWLRNMGKIFGNKYEITVIYDEIGPKLADEFPNYFKCVKYDNKVNYLCDRLLVTYSNYFYPNNIICIDKNYMFIHGNTSDYENSKHYYDDIYTEYVGVSKVAAEKAIGYYPREDIKYVYNPYILDETIVRPHLKLVTTMRSSDIKRPERIAYFAELLDELDIPYTWNMFTDKNENTNINGLIYRKRVVNPMPYVNDSDYFVLFSDSESFSYSVVEALSVNTKVLVTPLEVYDEIGVKDGENAYVIPFEYFEEKNKSKLKELIIKIYEDKDRKINYKFNPKLYEGFNDIFIE